MIAFKSNREGNDPVSGHPWTERRRKLKSGLTFELCTGMDGGLASWERGV